MSEVKVNLEEGRARLEEKERKAIENIDPRKLFLKLKKSTLEIFHFAETAKVDANTALQVAEMAKSESSYAKSKADKLQSKVDTLQSELDNIKSMNIFKQIWIIINAKCRT